MMSTRVPENRDGDGAQGADRALHAQRSQRHARGGSHAVARTRGLRPSASGAPGRTSVRRGRLTLRLKA